MPDGITGLLPCACVVVGLLIPLAWVIAMYNSLVRARQHVKEAWAQIDVELKRRYNLIPNLVETVKGYAEHEQATLELALKARNQACANEHDSPADQARDENEMVHALGRLLAVAEDYPDLKADRHFLVLYHDSANTENRGRNAYSRSIRSSW